MADTPRAVSALKRFAQTSRDHAAARCELCGRAIGPDHPHLLELTTRALACSCDPCSLLFVGQGGARYRPVPRAGRVLAAFAITDEQWDRLQTPIGLAFVVPNSTAGRVIAHYPSPAGAITSDIPEDAWRDLTAANPVLADLTPDVEALLVNRVRAARDYLRAPIDACYELAGLVRSRWRGLSGGNEVWAEVERFFTRARERWHA